MKQPGLNEAGCGGREIPDLPARNLTVADLPYHIMNKNDEGLSNV